MLALRQRSRGQCTAGKEIGPAQPVHRRLGRGLRRQAHDPFARQGFVYRTNAHGVPQMRINAKRCRRRATGVHFWVFLEGAVLLGFFLCAGFAAGLCVHHRRRRRPGGAETGFTGVLDAGDSLFAGRRQRRRERRCTFSGCASEDGSESPAAPAARAPPPRWRVQIPPGIAARDVEQRGLAHAFGAAALEPCQPGTDTWRCHLGGNPEHCRVVETPGLTAGLGGQRPQRCRRQRR